MKRLTFLIFTFITISSVLFAVNKKYIVVFKYRNFNGTGTSSRVVSAENPRNAGQRVVKQLKKSKFYYGAKITIKEVRVLNVDDAAIPVDVQTGIIGKWIYKKLNRTIKFEFKINKTFSSTVQIMTYRELPGRRRAPSIAMPMVRSFSGKYRIKNSTLILKVLKRIPPQIRGKKYIVYQIVKVTLNKLVLREGRNTYTFKKIVKRQQFTR